MEKRSTAGMFSSDRGLEQAQSRRCGSCRLVGAGILVLGLLAPVVVAGQGSKQSPDIPGVQLYSNLGHAHTTAPVSYDPVPPVGGNHSPDLLNCGIYDKPVPNENAVHSLEHGAVWITYEPTLSQSSVGKLRRLVQGHDHLILSPYPNLTAPVVASGWGIQLKLTGVDDPRLPSFIRKYEQGLQAREPGAPCSGGIGVPIGH